MPLQATSMPRLRHKVRGFSLLELMLVLVIMALMMGTIASSLTEGPVLRQATREVATSLRHARSLAILRQQEVTWSMDIARKHFWTSADPEQRQLHESIETKVHTSAAEVISPQQGNIRFYPDGSSTGGSVELSMRGEHYTVNVEWISGRVNTL